MRTLENIYNRRRPLNIVDAKMMAKVAAYPLKASPSSMDEVLPVVQAQHNLLRSLEGVIFDPSRIRVGMVSVVDSRIVMRLKVYPDDGSQPVVVTAYRSSGQNYRSTGKMEGDWYVILGIAENGWFVKTNGLIDACRGYHLYLTNLTQYLGLMKLDSDVDLSCMLKIDAA